MNWTDKLMLAVQIAGVLACLALLGNALAFLVADDRDDVQTVKVCDEHHDKGDR